MHYLSCRLPTKRNTELTGMCVDQKRLYTYASFETSLITLLSYQDTLSFCKTECVADNFITSSLR